MAFRCPECSASFDKQVFICPRCYTILDDTLIEQEGEAEDSDRPTDVIAMAEVVGTLEADPATDWSKVDMERLRQHLIDMDEVVLRAAVKGTQVPDGLSMDITGTGRTVQSIRAMVIPHSAELDAMPAWSAKAEPISEGVRLIVVARDPSDAKTVTRIRGLGFGGLLVQGGHHAPHHLTMAKGEMPASHKH